MMEEAIYRVVAREGDWCVEYEGRVLSQYGTREMAVLHAAEHARAKAPSRVVALDVDGTVVEDTPYRDDFDTPVALTEDTTQD
ncbi:MAG: hypothetical protein ACTH2Q_19580 [Propionibacteriaceae bacterium]